MVIILIYFWFVLTQSFSADPHIQFCLSTLTLLLLALLVIVCLVRQMRMYVAKSKERGYVLPERWRQPPLATAEELKAIFEGRTINRFRAIGCAELREALVKLKRTKLQARGFATEAATVKVSRLTALSYKCQAALKEYTATTARTLSKTNRRFQAVNTLGVSRFLYSDGPKHSFHLRRRSASSYPS